MMMQQFHRSLKKLKSSVLIKVEKAYKIDKDKRKKTKEKLKEVNGKKQNGVEQNHFVHYDENDENIKFEPIVIEKEPWVSGDYERNSYCLYYNKEGSETETLQLLVGRTTVQIWNQVQNCSKNKDELPNKGEPFLEYIWTNRIPVNQEREKTRLQIEKFEYETNDELHDKLT